MDRTFARRLVKTFRVLGWVSGGAFLAYVIGTNAGTQASKIEWLLLLTLAGIIAVLVGGLIHVVCEGVLALFDCAEHLEVLRRDRMRPTVPQPAAKAPDQPRSSTARRPGESEADWIRRANAV